MPVSALQQRMAVFIRTEGSLSGSAPSREGDQWPPMAMASSLPLIPTKNWKRETDGYNRRATGQRYNGVEVWQVEKAQRWIKTEKNKRGQWKIKSKINKKYQGYYNNSRHQLQFFHMRRTQQWNRKWTSLSAHFGCHHFILNDNFAHDLRLFSNLPRFARTEIIIKKTQVKHESQAWSTADLWHPLV